MKELYISPELELIRFVAEEKLASDVDFGGVGEGGGIGGIGGIGGGEDGISDSSDIVLPGFPGVNGKFGG